MLLRFTTSQDRAAFIARLEDLAPHLRAQVRPSFSEPEVMRVSGVTPQDEAELKSLVKADKTIKKAYDDVQFSPFDAAAAGG